jgi:hypothetical protein
VLPEHVDPKLAPVAANRVGLLLPRRRVRRRCEPLFSDRDQVPGAAPRRWVGTRGNACMARARQKGRWQIAAGPGDFLPILVGCVLLFLTVPPFLMLLLGPIENSGVIGTPLLVVLGTGILFGFGFVVLGVQLLSMPGSLLYRLSHGRFFRH